MTSPGGGFPSSGILSHGIPPLQKWYFPTAWMIFITSICWSQDWIWPTGLDIAQKVYDNLYYVIIFIALDYDKHIPNTDASILDQYISVNVSLYHKHSNSKTVLLTHYYSSCLPVPQTYNLVNLLFFNLLFIFCFTVFFSFTFLGGINWLWSLLVIGTNRVLLVSLGSVSVEMSRLQNQSCWFSLTYGIGVRIWMIVGISTLLSIITGTTYLLRAPIE